MEYLNTLMSTVEQALNQSGATFIAIPLAFFLGLLSALVSAVCTLPILGAIVGYAGIQNTDEKNSKWLSAVTFFIGAALSLIILGGVAAVVGQAAQGVLGQYWKIFAGFVAILMGLAAMKILPMPMKKEKRGFDFSARMSGRWGALLFGLIGGGAVSVASLSCNPGIFIIIGTAVLQGVTWWLVGVLIAFSLGFALPLGGLMLGVSYTTASVKFRKIEKFARILAGLLLLLAGFYFIGTV